MNRPTSFSLRSIRACALACGLALAAALGAGASEAVPVRAGGAAAAGCPTSGLVVWLNTTGDGAAGSIYYKLEFTNLSGHVCTLHGYPGVSGVGLGGGHLGSPAARIASTVHTVSLAAGATATATLRIVEAGNFPASACHQATAAALRVYPPNQTASRLVPFPFGACSHAGPVYLFVAAVTA